MFKKYCEKEDLAIKKLSNANRLASFNSELNCFRDTFMRDFFITDLSAENSLERILRV